MNDAADVPQLMRSGLEKLQTYVHNFYPERAGSDPIPLAFWEIDDDDLFMEALSYMPLHVFEIAETHFADMPIGFQIAYPIFSLEDDYMFNGWTALTNAGVERLPHAIAAYERVGMKSEAMALQAALHSCQKSPDDSDAAADAYKSIANVFADDEKKQDALLSFFRSNPQLWLVTRAAK